MRKRLITPMPTPQDVPPVEEGWLELDRAVAVEVTSEAKEYPVESALVLGEMRGWRADASGTQTIRLIFDRGEPEGGIEHRREWKPLWHHFLWR